MNSLTSKLNSYRNDFPYPPGTAVRLHNSYIPRVVVGWFCDENGTWWIDWKLLHDRNEVVNRRIFFAEDWQLYEPVN